MSGLWPIVLCHEFSSLCLCSVPVSDPIASSLLPLPSSHAVSIYLIHLRLAACGMVVGAMFLTAVHERYQKGFKIPDNEFAENLQKKKKNNKSDDRK